MALNRKMYPISPQLLIGLLVLVSMTSGCGQSTVDKGEARQGSNEPVQFSRDDIVAELVSQKNRPLSHRFLTPQTGLAIRIDFESIRQSEALSQLDWNQLGKQLPKTGGELDFETVHKLWFLLDSQPSTPPATTPDAEDRTNQPKRPPAAPGMFAIEFPAETSSPVQYDVNQLPENWKYAEASDSSFFRAFVGATQLVDTAIQNTERHPQFGSDSILIQSKAPVSIGIAPSMFVDTLNRLAATATTDPSETSKLIDLTESILVIFGELNLDSENLLVVTADTIDNETALNLKSQVAESLEQLRNSIGLLSSFIAFEDEATTKEIKTALAELVRPNSIQLEVVDSQFKLSVARPENYKALLQIANQQFAAASQDTQTDSETKE